MTFTRIGIIDIGSNSIRLVIYERTRQGAHRVISEHKESARLSERISTDGTIHTEDILSIVPILSHFTLLCKKNKVISVRAVATAAIRNASNSKEIVNVLQQETGLTIEVLSGYEEARFGFLGVINSLDIQDGIIVDIGGGSTEVTLFRNRKLEHTVSLPFGSVNTAKQFMNDGFIDLSDQSPLRIMVERALADHPWISMNPGLPLIGLGGTIRTLGKMSQKHIKYSLPLTHNYVMKNGELEYFLGLLPALPLEKRKKIEGLSKDRADIIIPGLAILQTIHTTSKASPIIVSGSGLRDGLFQETVHPDQPEIQNVLEASIQNLILLHHPEDAEIHIHQVNKLAMALFDQIAPNHLLSEKERRYLYAAALLYRIGVSVNYYQYSKHTQYILTQARIDGFSHREILLCALIASYKTKSRSHQMVLKHKDILEETDESLIIQLGTLLHTAIALDKSETQPIEQLNVQLAGKELNLQLHCRSNPFTELRELKSLQKDFQKAWGYKLTYEIAAFSTK